MLRSSGMDDPMADEISKAVSSALCHLWRTCTNGLSENVLISKIAQQKTSIANPRDSNTSGILISMLEERSNRAVASPITERICVCRFRDPFRIFSFGYIVGNALNIGRFIIVVIDNGSADLNRKCGSIFALQDALVEIGFIIDKQ